MNWFSGRLEIWLTGNTSYTPDHVYHDVSLHQATDILNKLTNVTSALYHPAVVSLT